MSNHSINPTRELAQLDNAGQAKTRPSVTIIARRQNDGRWWDAPFKKRVVPLVWSPAEFINCISTVYLPSLGGELVPWSMQESGKCYSFVAVAVQTLDVNGQPKEMSPPSLRAIRSRAVEGRVPGSVLVVRRGRCFVVFLLERQIAGGEQPEGDTAPQGTFHRASLGAEWLVRQSLADLSIDPARPELVEDNKTGGRTRRARTSGTSRSRSVLRLADGLAAQALLLDSSGIPVDGNVLPSAAPEYLSLRDKLWHPEELASYAPPLVMRSVDPIWTFVQALRDKQKCESARTRLKQANEDLQASGWCEADVERPQRLDKALVELSQFAVNWSEANEGLVAAGLTPMGVRSAPFSATSQTYDSLWDPSSLFLHEFRRRLREGEWHVTSRDGQAPHGLGTELTELGWRCRDNGECMGGTSWRPSGNRIGWIDYRVRELLLDAEMLASGFRNRGPDRCASLCMNHAQLGNVLKSSGLLLGAGASPTMRTIAGKNMRVFRVRFECITGVTHKTT